MASALSAPTTPQPALERSGEGGRGREGRQEEEEGPGRSRGWGKRGALTSLRLLPPYFSHFVHADVCRYFADQMGQKGLIGMVLAQSPEFVAPHGAKEAVFGTNPIAISIPSKVGADGGGGGRW